MNKVRKELGLSDGAIFGEYPGAGDYHGSRVRNFTPEQKELFYSTLERWLGLTLARL